jgi:hypothetical protein
VNDQIRKIQEHIYAKYVDPSDHGTLDEEAALRVLEDYYKSPEHQGDSECFFPGILYFELGFAAEEKQAEYFRRAKYWLERSRSISNEDWDAIDDRLADLDGWFRDAGIEVASAPQVSAPAHGPGAALPKEIDDHGTMLLVPAGTFLFGPKREARSIPAFYLDKHPVTNRQYEAFCRATGYRWPKYWTDVRFNGPEQPVVGVSAADAVKYCRWVAKDLPTEEQWEKAARGTDGRAYPWGNDPPKDGVACWGRDPETGKTDPVKANPKSASPFGVLDLAGNVWEWTSTTIEDGETFQIVKGGCFSDPDTFLRADARLEVGPKDKFDAIGFRCMRAV